MKKTILLLSMAAVCMTFSLPGSGEAADYRLHTYSLDDATGQFLGKPVKTYRGEVLGILQALVGDRLQVLYAVLSETENTTRLIPIPVKATDPYLDEGEVKINVDRRKLKNAPDFRKGSPPDLQDPSWHEAICSYWGVDTIFPRNEYKIVINPALR